jgi:hypothetical protein
MQTQRGEQGGKATRIRTAGQGNRQGGRFDDHAVKQ